MSLPIECIESILDVLHGILDTRTLFSLLTVNRTFFGTSVRRLYANPVESLEASCQFGLSYDSGVRGLVALIVRYSPAQDADVQVLRSQLSEEVGALPERPTVDYLSLIKCMPFKPDYFGPSTRADSFHSKDVWRDFLNGKSSLHDALTWAACGHRLSDVHDIDISWNGLDRYLGRVDDMTQMRSIRLRLLDPPFSRTSDWITVYQPVIQGGLQSVSKFMDKWSGAYAKLGSDRRHVDMQLVCNETRIEWWTIESLSQGLKDIFRQMPRTVVHKMGPHNILEWERCHLAPETIDLSRVKTMVVPDYRRIAEGRPENWMAAIYQKCQSLRRLKLNCRANRDIDCFSWALQGQRDSTTMGTRGPCSIPLSDLKLLLHNIVPWENVIYPFKATLQSVTIIEHSWSNRIDLCVFQNMPELQTLIILGCFAANNSASAFSGCPGLRRLALYCRRSNNLEQFDRWDLSNVQTLELGGPTCRAFHPATLQTMKRIKSLWFSEDFEGTLPDGGPPFTWDMKHWVHFPSLGRIHLDGAQAQAFRWQMLDQCPSLETLQLIVVNGNLAKEPVLCMESSTLPLTAHSAMRYLHLRGLYIAQRDLMDVLPTIVPNLTTLFLVKCVDLDVEQQDLLQAKFPMLNQFNFKGCTSRPVSDTAT